MKTIEKPFGQSAISKVMQSDAQYEIKKRHLDDLKFIRNKIAKNQMTPALYDFINLDGTMDRLFPSLPHPTECGACEGLTSTQLHLLDNYISIEMIGIKEFALDYIWKPFEEWIINYIDRCRWERRKLDELRAEFVTNGSIFGDRGTFAQCQVMAYNKANWTTMVGACTVMNDVTKQIVGLSNDKLRDSVDLIKSKSEASMSLFGYSYDDTNHIIRSQIAYTKMTRSCADDNYRFEEIVQYIDNALRVLKDDIQNRTEFNALKGQFKAATDEDKTLFRFLRDYVMTSRACSLHTARSMRVMLNQIRRTVRKPSAN